MSAKTRFDKWRDGVNQLLAAVDIAIYKIDTEIATLTEEENAVHLYYHTRNVYDSLMETVCFTDYYCDKSDEYFSDFSENLRRPGDPGLWVETVKEGVFEYRDFRDHLSEFREFIEGKIIEMEAKYYLRDNIEL